MILDNHIIDIILKECISIFKSIKSEYNVEYFGKFPNTAIIKYSRYWNEKTEAYSCDDTAYTWRLQDGKLSEIDNKIYAESEPTSGMYFKEAEFWIGSVNAEGYTYIVYFFGKRFGACIKYHIEVDGGIYNIKKLSKIWVS